MEMKGIIASGEHEESSLQLAPGGRLRPGGASWSGSPPASPGDTPRAARRAASSLRVRDRDRDRRAPPAVTFNVENEDDSDDGRPITFSARPASPPALGNLRKTADILRKVSSAERLTRLKDRMMSRERSPPRSEADSEDESAPLVAGEPGAAPGAARVECGCRSPPDAAAGPDLSPRSDVTELESPRAGATAFDLLPEGKGDAEAGARPRERARAAPARADSGELSDSVEPYNMRLLASGASDARALWRQDALDAGPPWPWDEPDSAV